MLKKFRDLKLNLFQKESFKTFIDCYFYYFIFIFTGLFDKCAYEYSMLRSVNRIVYSDLHDQLAKTLTEAKCGISSPESCSLCQHSFKNQLLLFRFVLMS